MLFSMGLGSRLSKNFENDLLGKFITTEFTLSIIASNVTIIVYAVFALFGHTLIIIYTLSIVVGLLIGMEIPLVIRLNEQFQSLRFNISSAMENDYYGSLAGGVFFAFVGLPILGLQYTPLVLGAVNFLVAIVFIAVIWRELRLTQKRYFSGFAGIVLVILLLTGVFSDDVVRWGDRVRYKDEIVYSEQSRYQKIVLTKSDRFHWLYINGHQQLSTMDEELYHEPLVHPAMLLHSSPRDILILGGGDGAAAREVLKYDPTSVTLVDLDPMMTDLGRDHPVLKEINHDAFADSRVDVINEDAFTYIEKSGLQFDVIIADFPDPRTVDLGRLYSREFYWLCQKVLCENGILITQATSPYYAQAAFECIDLTMKAAGFNTLKLHNQVLTLGEWGWILGTKELGRDLKKDLIKKDINVETEWLTNDALVRISHFGNEVFPERHKSIEVNRIHNPVLYKYYLNGYWDLY